MYYSLSRPVAALIISMALLGCSTSTRMEGASTSLLPVHSVTIDQAAKPKNHYLACYRGEAKPECNLRTYQIMVESFIDGDAKANFNTGYGSSHHKGDLQGIINSLDYIQSLGVNAIWLTPIFESSPIAGQDHFASRLDATGYFTSNYFAIDPRFGTLEQAKTLVDEAHKRGLYVFLDGVFGHYKENLRPSPSGRLPKSGPCYGSNGATYSGPHWACADYQDPATLAFFSEVASYWIKELKIDGWRLDQAYQVPLAAWSQLRSQIRSTSQQVTYSNKQGEIVHPLAYMVAEIWDNERTIARTAYGTDEQPALDSAFDFPLRYRLVQTLAVEEEYATSNRGSLPASTLDEGFNTWRAYPAHAMPNLMLGNHDLVRFGDLLERGGIANPTQADYWLRHQAVFSFLAAFSGSIILYYGEEIGQELSGFADKQSSGCIDKGVCDDHVARSSGQVDGVPPEIGLPATKLSPQQQALRHYLAKLMQMRAAHPALYSGSRTHLYADSQLYVDRKDAGSDQILYALNTRETPAAIQLAGSLVDQASKLVDLMTGETVTPDQEGNYQISVPPLTGRFLQLQKTR